MLKNGQQTLVGLSRIATEGNVKHLQLLVHHMKFRWCRDIEVLKLAILNRHLHFIKCLYEWKCVDYTGEYVMEYACSSGFLELIIWLVDQNHASIRRINILFKNIKIR